jgi:hypothetical protein
MLQSHFRAGRKDSNGTCEQRPNLVRWLAQLAPLECPITPIFHNLTKFAVQTSDQDSDSVRVYISMRGHSGQILLATILFFGTTSAALRQRGGRIAAFQQPSSLVASLFSVSTQKNDGFTSFFPAPQKGCQRGTISHQDACISLVSLAFCILGFSMADGGFVALTALYMCTGFTKSRHIYSTA